MTHSEHHPLESLENRGDATMTGLRHRDVELRVTGASGEGTCDRAAFAIEEARSPREISSIKFRSKSIQMISRPARPTTRIEHMVDTVNGR